MANISSWAPIYNDIFMNVMANALSRKNAGYYVISGCDVHANTPAGMNVIVDSGEISFNGVKTSVTGNSVSITSDGSNPRFYTIYINNSGVAVGHQGTPASISPAGETLFRKMESPYPPDSTPDGVILAVIYVPAGATSITDSHILDIAEYGSQYTEDSFSNTGASGKIPVGQTSGCIDYSWIGSMAYKNYIGCSDAEIDDTGWTTYNDGASNIPVDGTGGTPTISWGRSTSTPIRGTGSFLLTKSGVNKQGQGVSYDFTIDNADIASMLRISLEFQSDVTLSEGDLIIYIYDKDNGQLLQPSPYKLPGTNANVINKWYGEFQTSASPANDYRLIIHIASTSTTTWNIKFDNIYVGPNRYTNGIVMSEWQSFTPTGTFTSNTTYSGKWRRVGNCAEYQISLTFTGQPNATILRLNLLHTIDTSNIVDSGHLQVIFGTGNFIDDSVPIRYDLMVASSGDVNTVLVARKTVSGSNLIFQDEFSASSPVVIANGDKVTVKFTVPVAGWGVNCSMSTDADTRVVAFRAYKNGDQSIPNAIETKLTTFTTAFDTHGGWDASNNKYIIPVPGKYVIGAKGHFDAIAGSSERIILYSINGSMRIRLAHAPSLASAYSHPNGSEVVDLLAGDYIEFYAYQSSGSSLSIKSGALMAIYIYRLSGPAQIAASESVYTSANLSGTVNLAPNASNVKINLNSTTVDSHACFNTSTYKWVCPRSGAYRVDFMIALRSTNILNNRYFASLYKNGTEAIRGMDITPQTNTYLNLVGSGILRLVAGDYLELYLYGAGNNSSSQLIGESGTSGCQLHVSSI